MIFFQVEIENLLTEISSYECLIASKRLEIERFQDIGGKISQGAKLLEEAIALAAQHGREVQAVAAIRTQLIPFGLSTTEQALYNPMDTEEPEEVIADLDEVDQEGADFQAEQLEEAPILEAIALANSQVEQQADPQVERADSQVDSPVEQQSGEVQHQDEAPILETLAQADSLFDHHPNAPTTDSFSVRVNGALVANDLSEGDAQREFANAQAQAASDKKIWRIELRHGATSIATWPEPIKEASGEFESEEDARAALDAEPILEEPAQGTVIRVSARISYASAIHTAYFGGFDSQESAIAWLERLRNCFALEDESVAIREEWQGEAPTGFWEIKLMDCSEDGVHLIVQNCPLEAESWERLSARVWFQQGQTVLLFKTKKQATLWGKQVGLMLGLPNWSVNPSTVSDTNLEAFKAELRIPELGKDDALALTAQNLDSDPAKDSFKACPGNIYRKGAIEKLVARLKEAKTPQDLANIKADRGRLGIGYEDLAKSLSPDERARIDQIRHLAHKAA